MKNRLLGRLSAQLLGLAMWTVTSLAADQTTTPTVTATPKVVPIAELFTIPANDGTKLSVEWVRDYLAKPENHEPIVPAAPLGLQAAHDYIPADNPMTRAKVELGRLLYFDPRLSRDESISCATCHRPNAGWADPDQFSVGINGQLGGRQAPSVMNRLYGKVQFWDGRAASLEEQSLGPIQNPVEMGFTLPELLERLQQVPVYRLMFEKVFGEMTPENIAKAIASFERTVLVGDSPYDYFEQAKPFLELDEEERAELMEELEPADRDRAQKILHAVQAQPLSESAERGRKLYFGKAQCSVCHVGHNLSDEMFYNIGVGMDQEKLDVGQEGFTKQPEHRGAFKTPSLRNIAASAPYMHDGSMKTLEEVVEFYNKGGVHNATLSNRIKKLDLTKEEVTDLVVFMKEGLTGPMPPITAPRLP